MSSRSWLLFALALPLAGVDVGPRGQTRRRRCCAVGSRGRARDPLRLGRPSGAARGVAERSGRRLPPKAGDAVAHFVQTFAEGLKVMRSPGHLAVAAPGRCRSGSSIAAGHLVHVARLRFDGFLRGVVHRRRVPGGRGGRCRRRAGRAGSTDSTRLALTQFFGADPTSAGGRGHRPARRVLRAGDDRRAGLHVAGWADAGRVEEHEGRGAGGGQAGRRSPANEVSLLRPSGRQGRGLAREQGRRSHPPPPRVPRVRPPLHELRADRRDPVHGREEGRPARAVRASEARRRDCSRRARSGRCAWPRSRRSPTRSSRRCRRSPSARFSTEDIGAYRHAALKQLDKVAFVRFASVYRNFRDLDEFKHELQGARSGLR